MTFYNEKQLKQLGALITTFDPTVVLIIVGTANEEEGQIEFNLTSKLDKVDGIQALEGYIQHLKQEHIAEGVEKPVLKIIED